MASCRKNKNSTKKITDCSANAALHPDVRRTMQATDITAHVRQNIKETSANTKEVAGILTPLLCCFHTSNATPLVAKPAADTPLTTSKVIVDRAAIPVVRLWLPDRLIRTALYSKTTSG